VSTIQKSPQEFLAQVRKLRRVLQGVDFMSRLKIEELEMMVETLKMRQVPRGHIIISQGDKKADAFFMIATGRCTVWAKKGGQMEKIADLMQDEYFGERALVTHEPRAATVRAETPCELYVMFKDDFDKVLMHNPEIASQIKLHIAQYKNR
jgi:CRP-like cAMP-binding protein